MIDGRKFFDQLNKKDTRTGYDYGYITITRNNIYDYTKCCLLLC